MDSVLDKELYDVLNAVTLKKMAGTAAAAAAIGRSPDDVARAFDALAGKGLVMMVGDAAMPMDTAETTLTTAASWHYEQLRGDPMVEEVADRFDDVNERFLAAMAAWQQVDVGGRKVANDHQDPAYDAKVIGRLEKLVARLQTQLEVLAERDARFANYATRFDAALREVDGGSTEHVSAPTIDSLHNIWFEFHEDLLRTLGRARKE